MRHLPRPLLAAALATSIAACDDETRPFEPVEGSVLADVSGTLEAVPGATDTLDVFVPAGRLMGVILETSSPIVARYGGGPHDVVWSGFGGAFAAMVPQVGTGQVRLRIHRSEAELVEVEYRIRVIAVNEAPEHAHWDLDRGRFKREWIDPPLDMDIFAIELDADDSFAVELDVGSEEQKLTVGVLPPAGAGYYAFLGTAGPDRVRSDVFEVVVPGEHLLLVFSTGLAPDVELDYRIRVIDGD